MSMYEFSYPSKKLCMTKTMLDLSYVPAVPVSVADIYHGAGSKIDTHAEVPFLLPARVPLCFAIPWSSGLTGSGLQDLDLAADQRVLHQRYCP